MDTEGFWNSLRRDKYFALFVGLIVASLHFLITLSVLLLEERTYSVVHYLSEFIASILAAPSIVLMIMISTLLQIRMPGWGDFSPFSIPVLACSSVFYGITMGFLASSQKILHWVGIAFLILLTLLNCYILVLVY